MFETDLHVTRGKLGGNIYPYIQIATGAEMLSDPGSNPWAWNRYKYAGIKEGIFFGQEIDYWKIDDVKNKLDLYGVEYIILWSNGSKRYFHAYPNEFKHIKTFDDFDIFKYVNARPALLEVIGGGNAAMLTNKDNYKRIYFESAGGGTEIVLKYNYFPHWKAKINDTFIEIKNHEGVMMVEPTTQEGIIEFVYPGFIWINIAAGIAIILLIFISIISYIK